MTFNRIFIFSFSFLLFLVASFNLNAQNGFNLWENVSPPGQGNIVSIDCDFRNGRVYAVDKTEGLFISKNGGRIWNKIFNSENGLFNNSVGVKVPLNKKGVVFYALQNALYKSADSGKNWSELTGYKSGGIVSFDINQDSGDIYIAGRKWIDLLTGNKRKRIYRVSGGSNISIRSISADPYLVSRVYINFINGDTACLVKKGIERELINMESSYRINLLAGDPWTLGRVFALSDSNILVRDEKEGRWQRVGEIGGLEKSPCLPASFIISKRRKGLMFASYPGCGVFMSRNGGRKWSNIIPGNYFVLSLAEKLPGKKIVCGTLGDGIILWSPFSSRWEKRNIIGGYINNFTYSSDGLNKIFAITYSGRVFKSDDLAKNWNEITPRSNESFSFANSFISEGRKIEIAVDSEENCFIREDDNKSWKKTGGIVLEGNIVSLHGTVKGVYALTEKTLLHSDDGSKWRVVYSSDKNFGIENVSVSSGVTGKIIFSYENKIYIAENGLVIEDMPLPNENSRCLSAVFGNDETIYVLSDRNQNIYSRNLKDKEWIVFANYPESLKPSEILICSDNLNDFYILDTEGNLYRTSERGENWFQVYTNNYPLSSVKVFRSCSESKVILFNDYDGIFKSDTGFSFSAVTPGMGWRAKMISFPVKSNEMQNKKKKRIGRFISGKWHLYKISKRDANRYKEIKYVNQLKRGRGYWLIYSGSVTGTIPGSPADFMSNETLLLSPGWNMLANPFPYKIRISQIKVSLGDGKSVPFFSADNAITAKGLWKWSASKKDYIQTVVVNVGDSFWIKNISGTRAKVIIDPHRGGNLRKTKESKNVNELFPFSMPPLPSFKYQFPD